MVWVKVSDDEYERPEIQALSSDAYRLEKYARQYSSRIGTDGYLSLDQPMRLLTMRRPKQTILELLDGGFWHESARPCRECLELRDLKQVTVKIPKVGYLIHRYHDHQPAHWTVLRDRGKARDRMGQLRSGDVRPEQGDEHRGEVHGEVHGEVQPLFADTRTPYPESVSSTFPVTALRARRDQERGSINRSRTTRGSGLHAIDTSRVLGVAQ